MATNRYVLGIDLGQAHDPTAVAIIEHLGGVRDPVYQVRALHRYPLGTSYTRVVGDITHRVASPPLARRSMVAIDETGVGKPVIDLFKQDGRIRDVYGITITGGNQAGGSGHQLTVPKPDLINTTTIIFEQRRIRIAADLPDTPVLIDELLNYRIKTTDSGHHTYAPASSQDHDDLLLALSLALWAAEHRPVRYGTVSNPNRLGIRIPTQHDRYGHSWI